MFLFGSRNLWSAFMPSAARPRITTRMIQKAGFVRTEPSFFGSSATTSGAAAVGVGVVFGFAAAVAAAVAAAFAAAASARAASAAATFAAATFGCKRVMNSFFDQAL